MFSRNPIRSTGKIDPLLRWASLSLTFLGAVDAIYLLILKYTQSESMCIGNHGCITVNNSPYSMIYGIPVALLGLLAYLLMGVVLLTESRWEFTRSNGTMAVFGISLAGTAFSAYLTYLEYFVIFAVCPFCLASAILITLLFILSIVRLVRHLNYQ